MDNRSSKEAGQSVFEFLLLLPLMAAVTFITLRINSAIQTSIVDQKYSRSQALFLTYNNSIYPRLDQRLSSNNTFGALNADQMILGVSENLATENYRPEASAQLIVRTGQNIGDDREKREDARERGNVRIRNTVTLCTQFNPQGQITEGTRPTYCRSFYP